VRVVEMPLARVDLATEVREYSWLRARFPDRWRTWRYRRDQLTFPEKVFGSWRPVIEKSALQVHAERPVDLTLVSPAPYTMLPAGWALHKRGVPFAVDYRDAWSLDVIKGVEHFPVNSRAGRWEQRLMANAAAVWCVNEPILEFYQQRYPAAADRLRLVRNGFDASDDLEHPVRERAAGEPLRFGYLGTVNFPVSQTDALLAGWKQARAAEPALAGASLTFRGHLGAGAVKGANAHAQRITKAQPDGVSYGGPVRKADVHDVYGSWDALVLCLVGGRYVTSGKVYEYMATGLPIVSVHEPDHAATELLRDYPLHVPAASLAAADVGEALARGARLAATVTPEQRARARAFAAQYERGLQLRPAVVELHERFGGGTPASAERSEDALVTKGSPA
jgi:glycosyltransferase involved in cell wall biosynthesis